MCTLAAEAPAVSAIAQRDSLPGQSHGAEEHLTGIDRATRSDRRSVLLLSSEGDATASRQEFDAHATGSDVCVVALSSRPAGRGSPHCSGTVSGPLGRNAASLHGPHPGPLGALRRAPGVAVPGRRRPRPGRRQRRALASITAAGLLGPCSIQGPRRVPARVSPVRTLQ